jgi:hypothetical protein
MIELNISLTAASRNEVLELKKFTDADEHIEFSEVQYDVAEIEANKYLEVLYENEYFVVLKYHFKKNATTETVSLAKLPKSLMIADEDYYLAGPNKELVEFIFTKKSVEKSLNLLNISYDKEIQNIGSESRVLEWFKGNNFNLERN